MNLGPDWKPPAALPSFVGGLKQGWIVIDSIFGAFDKAIRRRYGLIDAATQ